MRRVRSLLVTVPVGVAYVLLLLVLLAVPVLAYTYYATYTVIESGGTDYTMLPVWVLSSNQWMADNGFMEADALDTRVGILDGTDYPHMVADDRTLTALAVPANTQTNLSFSTGNSDLSTMYIIVGQDGYVSADDEASLEASTNNFEVDWQGYFSADYVGNIVNKLQSYGIKVDTAGTVFGYTASTTSQFTQPFSPNGAGDYDNITSQFPATGSKWSVIDDPAGGEDDDTTYMYDDSNTEVKGVWSISSNQMEGTTFSIPNDDASDSVTTSGTIGGARFVARYHPTGHIWVVSDSKWWHYPVNTWVDEGVCTVAQGSADGVSIVADEDNTIHCLRSSWSGGVRYAYFPEGGSESATETVSGDLIDPSREVSAAVDSNGDIHVVWVGEGAPVNTAFLNLAYRVRDSGTDTWSSITWLTDIVDFQYAPSIAIDSSDNIHVFWLAFGWGANPTFLNMQYRMRNAGASWESRESVTDINASQNYGQIAVDGNGYPNVVWAGEGWGTNTTVRNIRYRLRTDTWQSPVAITDLPDAQSSPSIAVNGDGIIHAVWYGKGWGVNTTKNNIVEKEYSSSSWQASVVVIDRAQDSWSPKLIWATWPQLAGVSTQIPDVGYLFVFPGDDDATGLDLEYYASGDLSFPMANTGTGGPDYDAVIDQVRIYFRARGTDGGDTYYATPYLRMNSVEIQGTTVNPGVAYTTYNEILTRPGGGSWVAGDLVDLQIGVGLRTTNTTDFRVTQVYADITYTEASDEDGVTFVLAEGEHRIRLTRTAGTLELFTDEVSRGTDATVPDPVDNANALVVGHSGPARYTDFAKVTIDASQRLWHEPITMILSDTVPDRSGNSNDGNIIWGSNPSGVTVTLEGIVSASQPAPGDVEDEPPADTLPAVGGSDWFQEPDVSGALLTNPVRPFVILMSDTTSLTELQAWRFLGLAAVLFVTVGVAAMIKNHLLIAGIACCAAILGLVALTIWPTWTLVFALMGVLGGIVSERSPSL